MLKPEERPVQKKRAFTIELNSKRDVDKVMVPNGAEGFLVEGTIGLLRHASFVEDSVLEVTGTRGVLRVDLSMKELSSPVHHQVGNDPSMQ